MSASAAHFAQQLAMADALPEDSGFTCEPIDLAEIHPASFQPRVRLDEDAVQAYAARYAEGEDMPPVLVYYEGDLDRPDAFWLADGFHRVEALRRNGATTVIDALIAPGTQRDAMLVAIGVNHSHGVRLTNGDKRRIVESLLVDDEWRTWSDRSIAERAGVSHAFVSKHRRKMETAGLIGETPTRTTKTGVQQSADKAAPAEDDEPIVVHDDEQELTTAEGYTVTDAVIAGIAAFGDQIHVSTMGLHPVKCRILAALYLECPDPGMIPRHTLQQFVGVPLDVHAGQLVKSGHVVGNNADGYSLISKGWSICDDANGCPMPANAATPDGDGDRDEYQDAIPGNGEQSQQASPQPLDVRQAAARESQRAFIAEQIYAALDDGKPVGMWRGSLYDAVRLALVFGLDGMACHWDDLVGQNDSTVRDHLVDALAQGLPLNALCDGARGLPELDTLARLFGLDYASLKRAADDEHPLPKD